MSDQDEATKHDKPARQSQPRIAALPDFGPRYRVIAAIGKGGMGEVFRAYDNELKAEIAIKVVHDDHDEALARFRREIALARKVTSPNVLRVYDLAEHDGLRFLTMELVEGDDLAAVIRREKRMPLPRALAIFKQVCQGLAAAHAEGVVHRDLKPQNVLVDNDGRVRVADFGLARSIGDSGLTASGAVLGSPAYMSPEQVKGDPTDERSDIYSLGVMLYQLVTGEAPFKGDTPHALMEVRLHKAPRPVHEVVPDVPPYVEAIVGRCLELDPANRFPTMAGVLTALDSPQTAQLPPRRRKKRWIAPVIGGALVVAGAAVLVVAWPRGKHDELTTRPAIETPKPAPAPPQDATVRVLVLGFQNRTVDPLFDGTLDTLLDSALARSTKIDPYSGVELRNLANELDPGSALDEPLGPKLADRDHARVITVRGTIAAKGSAFAVTMTAKEAGTGAIVVEKSYDAATREAVVPVIGRIASDLRDTLGDPVPANEREKTGLSPVLAADHEYSVAFAMERTNDASGAISHLEQAIAKDSHFARARVLLATAYENATREVDGIAQYKLALQDIDQMGERDRLHFLGLYYDGTTQDFDRSIATYEELLAKWPHDLSGEINVAVAYFGRGDMAKALEWGRRGAADHPRDVTIRSNYAEYMMLAGQYAKAIDAIKQLLVDFPHPPEATWQYLAIAYVLSGARAEAVTAYADFVKADPANAASALGDFAISEGRLREAEQILTKAIDTERGQKLDDSIEIQEEMLAEVKLRRGDKPGARAAAAHVTRTTHRRFLAALVQIGAGDVARAQAVAKELSEDVAPTRRAYGKLVEAELARVGGKPQQALIIAQQALALADIPIVHFIAARAALDAKRFPEAFGDLDRCLAKQGQAAVTEDDVPTLRFIPQFWYFRAKAQEGIGADPKASYQAFLAMTHEPDADDPMVVDARKHVEGK